MLPDLADYIQLIGSFVDHRITAEEFERLYLRMFKDDLVIRPDEEYQILNQLFSDVDVLCTDPTIRPPDGIDENELRKAARLALAGLVRRSPS